MVAAHTAVWAIAGVSIALMLLRPFGVPEVVWTFAGALLLCVARLILWGHAAHAVAEGIDVYLFLTGMMLLSERARAHGVFDWLASIPQDAGLRSQLPTSATLSKGGIAERQFGLRPIAARSNTR